MSILDRTRVNRWLAILMEGIPMQHVHIVQVSSISPV